MYSGNQLEAPELLMEQFVYCDVHKIPPFLTTTRQTNTFHFLAQLVEALRYKPEGREFDSRFDFFP
jgi:hypothetical protein